MAPNADAAAVAAAPAAAPPKRQQKPRRISMEGLQRAMSDLALELARDNNSRTKQSTTTSVATAAATTKQQQQLLPAITEQQQQASEVVARCECCGMQEECTPQYVRRVRERYCGRWVCGLCAEAVNGEAEKKNKETTEEALAAHMAVCGRFNRVGRANPVLMQTEAMREILRKRCRSNSPREHGGRPAGAGGLTRSTSCIPAIAKDFNNSS